jgi:hypothetical protein
MDLLQSLQQFLIAFGDVLLALVTAAAPWIPLFAWIAFWALAVDWRKLHKVLWAGGLVGVVLIGLTWMLVWGVVSPPAAGFHSIFGLHLSNFTGKLVYVTTLIVIMYLCGSVQLAGLCDPFGRSLATAWNTDLEPADDHHDHGHGHDEGGHDHGHGEHLQVHAEAGHGHH